MNGSDQSKSSLSNRPVASRLRDTTVFFRDLLRPLAILVFFMSLMRFLLWWTLSERFSGASNLELMRAFFVGLRFDLLVLGFVLLPVVFAVPVFAIFRGLDARSSSFVLRYLMLAWSLLVASAALDFLFFSVENRHWSAFDWSATGLNFVGVGLQRLGGTTAILSLVIFFCLWLVGSRSILSVAFRPSSVEVPRGGLGLSAMRVLIPILLVALMARGTVTAHHLEMKDSVVSTHPLINELAVNSVWAFDKKPRDP